MSQTNADSDLGAGSKNQHSAAGRTKRQATDLDKWFLVWRPIAKPRARLFCLPHAGGNSSTFAAWVKDLPDDVEVCGILAPGKGARIDEPYESYINSLPELGAAINTRTDVPFAFLGVCMGALASYILAETALASGNPHPSHLFYVSPGPQYTPPAWGPWRRAKIWFDTTRTVRYLNRASDDTLFQKLQKVLPAVHPWVAADPEMRREFVRGYRIDATAAFTAPRPSGKRLPIPTTAIGGAQDDTSHRPTIHEILPAWSRWTQDGLFSYKLVAGGHAFYLDYTAAGTSELISTIRNVLQSPPFA